MGHMLIRHKVEEFDRWKSAYDDHESKRSEAGLSEVKLLRNQDDPNEVVILMDAPDRAKAEEFASSDDLREVMQNAGVVGPPDIMFLD